VFGLYGLIAGCSVNQNDSSNQSDFNNQLEAAGSLKDFEELAATRFEGQSQERIAQRRRRWYIETHPDLSPPAFHAISEGEIRLGMTSEQTRASWGAPTEIHRSVYTFGIHEQWVYGRMWPTYVYFEDGSLTSWQN
jgi:hypothetical protein